MQIKFNVDLYSKDYFVSNVIKFSFQVIKIAFKRIKIFLSKYQVLRFKESSFSLVYIEIIIGSHQ